MKPNRRLVLRREALHALDSEELAGVVGATHVPTDCGCMTHGFSCDNCAWSIDSCPTVPKAPTVLPIRSCKKCP